MPLTNPLQRGSRGGQLFITIAVLLDLAFSIAMVVFFFGWWMLSNITYYLFLRYQFTRGFCSLYYDIVYLSTLIFFIHVVKNRLAQNLEICANGNFSM